MKTRGEKYKNFIRYKMETRGTVPEDPNKPNYTGMGIGFMNNLSNIPKSGNGMSMIGKRLYDNIFPGGYLEERIENASGSKVKAFSKMAGNIILNKGRDFAGPEREEIWKYALGSNDDMTQWERSPYKPSNSKDSSATYLRLNNVEKDDRLMNHLLNATNNPDSSAIVNNKFILKNPYATDNDGNSYVYNTTDGKTNVDRFTNPFANYKVSRGTDEKGTYVSMYDKWDLDNIGDKFLKRKPEMYDRIYYEKSKDNSYKMKPDYGFGGIIQALAPFANLIPVPGLGTAIAGGLNVAGGLMEQAGAKKDALAQQEQMLAEQKKQNAIALGQAGQAGITNPYQSTFPYGGQVQGMTPVELEKEEVFQTPDGMMGQVDGPSHAQGGIDMDLPEGTFVWSDKLKTASGKTFADEAAYLGRLKAKYEKILMA